MPHNALELLLDVTPELVEREGNANDEREPEEEDVARLPCLRLEGWGGDVAEEQGEVGRRVGKVTDCCAISMRAGMRQAGGTAERTAGILSID